MLGILLHTTIMPVSPRVDSFLCSPEAVVGHSSRDGSRCVELPSSQAVMGVGMRDDMMPSSYAR